MHYMPDTEEADSAAETFWPEGYKRVIKEAVRQVVESQLDGGRSLRRIYQRQYAEKYTDLSQFTSKIADMIVIGADNGADDAFDDIISAFLTESPLPEERRYTRYLWPQALSPLVGEKLQQVIIDEYSQDDVFNHAFRVGYQQSYHDFNEFINRVARLVITGTANGADNMLAATYQSFLSHAHLPPARRYPRRLKSW